MLRLKRSSWRPPQHGAPPSEYLRGSSPSGGEAAESGARSADLFGAGRSSGGARSWAGGGVACDDHWDARSGDGRPLWPRETWPPRFAPGASPPKTRDPEVWLVG